ALELAKHLVDGPSLRKGKVAQYKHRIRGANDRVPPGDEPGVHVVHVPERAAAVGDDAHVVKVGIRNQVQHRGYSSSSSNICAASATKCPRKSCPQCGQKFSGTMAGRGRGGAVRAAPLSAACLAARRAAALATCAARAFAKFSRRAVVADETSTYGP